MDTPSNSVLLIKERLPALAVHLPSAWPLGSGLAATHPCDEACLLIGTGQLLRL